MTNTVQLLTIIGILLTIATTLVGSWRGWWESPKRRSERAQNEAVAHAILGEKAVKDDNGTFITPGQPGLVHRVATVEGAVVAFAENHLAITQLRDDQRQLVNRVKALEDSRIERLVNRAESAQMWRAVADNAASDVDDDDQD